MPPIARMGRGAENRKQDRYEKKNWKAAHVVVIVSELTLLVTDSECLQE
jgi:hypothetical protein